MTLAGRNAIIQRDGADALERRDAEGRALFRVGDIGTTRGGMRYRILAVDLAGKRGPIVAALRIGEDDMLHRFLADGTNDGGPAAYHLLPARD